MKITAINRPKRTINSQDIPEYSFFFGSVGYSVSNQNQLYRKAKTGIYSLTRAEGWLEDVTVFDYEPVEIEEIILRWK